MRHYAAPQRDMRFVIHELIGLEPMRRWPGFEELDTGLIDTVINEAGRFGSQVLAPLNHSGDQQGARWHDMHVTVPDGFRDAYRQFVEAGWPGLACDPALGGQGLPRLVGAAVQEIWKSANHAWSICQALTLGGVEALMANGSPSQQGQYLPALVHGRWTATMNLTEPQAGSDLSQVRTRAVRQADGRYRIFGQKIFISFGEHDMSENIVHFVLARVPDAPQGTRGVSLFLVPKFLPDSRGLPGERNDVYCLGIEHKLGLHGSPTCVMTYGEHGGALGELVGREHEGLKCMFTMMNSGRVSAGLEGLGVAERAYQQAVAYARQRLQGRTPGNPAEAVPIMRHPDVRRMLMLMRSHIEAMRALCYWAAALQDAAARHPDPGERARHSTLADLMTPVVKGWCTEVGFDIAQLGIQVHGGTGYVEDTGAAQYLRDVRISTIYEGTTGIQANDLIGRKVVRDGGAAIRTLLSEMQRSALELNAHAASGRGPTLQRIRDALLRGIAALAGAVDHVLVRADRDPRGVAVGAVPFLHLTGIVSGGWMAARAAGLAAQRLAQDGDDPFYAAKIATACFYAEHVLPHAHAHAHAACAGEAGALDIAEELL
jgi:alkylation response protein AidB-like acyl-CoA dehydrogenase